MSRHNPAQGHRIGHGAASPRAGAQEEGFTIKREARAARECASRQRLYREGGRGAIAVP